MYYHQDWILRQIQILINLIKSILSKGKTYQFSETDNENNEVKVKVESLIKNHQLNEAEQIIFKYMSYSKRMDMALWFYESVNNLSDSELEMGEFSRRKILNSMKEICIYNNLLDASTIDFLINSETE